MALAASSSRAAGVRHSNASKSSSSYQLARAAHGANLCAFSYLLCDKLFAACVVALRVAFNDSQLCIGNNRWCAAHTAAIVPVRVPAACWDPERIAMCIAD